MLNLIIIFIASVTFNNLFFQWLFNKDTYLTENVLINIQQDFEKIAFPLMFELNSFFVSIVISLITIVLIKTTKINEVIPKEPLLFIYTYFKLFFIYFGALFSVMYLLRLYNFSRGFLILAAIAISIALYIVNVILNTKIFFKSSSNKFFLLIPLLLLFFLLFVLNRQSNNENISVLSSTTTTTSPTVTVGISDEADCNEWYGSDNFGGCIPGLEIKNIEKFSESLNNIVVFENNVFVLDVFGKVYKNNNQNIFIDISDKVLNRIDEDSGEYGLFSIAFHPTDNYFLISYSDKKNNLIVDKYLLNNNKEPIIESLEEVVRIPNPGCCHFSGNIIWSNYFNNFLISIGDMESNVLPLENSEPIDTTQPRGKILILNEDISKPDLLASTDKYPPREDILAFGLRNPWKTVEYDNKLFVVDIGNYEQEELNIVDLRDFSKTKKPFLFGWPFFEGNINNQIQYSEILFHNNTEKNNIIDYVNNNSILPNLYYFHQAPTNYRAALIGGGVIENEKSKYFEHYIFADFLSNELFAYDFKNDLIYILPMSDLGTNVNSVVISPYEQDEILVATWSGLLITISLP